MPTPTPNRKEGSMKITYLRASARLAFSALLAASAMFLSLACVSPAFADDLRNSIGTDANVPNVISDSNDYDSVSSGENGIATYSVYGSSYAYQVDYEQQAESTTVTVTLPNLDSLISMDKADSLTIEASMSYNGTITRFVTKKITLEELEGLGGSFGMDFQDYGKFQAVAKFYKDGALVKTGDTQTIGITANEYNIAPVSATLPVTFFSLCLWGDNDIRHNADGGIIPTIMLFERPNAYNWNNLPEGTYGLPFVSKEDIAYQPSDFGDAASAFMSHSQAMADYVADLYEMNPSSKFNLYCVDYYLGLIQTILYANDIPDGQYAITVLSDGSWSYSEFSYIYDSENPQATHNELIAEWNEAKEYARENGTVRDGFYLAGPRAMMYAAVDSEPNAQWWLARPALLESTGDGNVFGKQVQNNTDKVVRFYIDRKLKSLQAEGDQSISEFKSLYNFSDSYFADAEAAGKDVMLFLGTTIGNEAGGFADYAKFAMTFYGDKYAYYYKGHPGSPTDFYPEKQQELNRLGITDVDSSIAAELILFFYPDIYLSGYTSSTYASISNPDMAKGLFRITKADALSSTSGDYSTMDWFISPIGDSTNSDIRALCKGGTNYLVEFSDAYLDTVDYDIGIWNATTETIEYYRQADNGAYEFISSNKPTTTAGSWQQANDGHWWYRYDNGGYPQNTLEYINGETYGFDGDGWMLTGWSTSIDGAWRYFANSGVLQTGWLFDGGRWYYLNAADGALETGWFTVNGTWYFADASGAMQIGWIKQGSTWYHLDQSGKMITGWQSIEGSWYYFDASGAMQTGWAHIDQSWYYLNDDGSMYTGWLNLGGDWHYLNYSGAMATNWKYLNQNWYYFDGSGTMQSGWVEEEGEWYYLTNSGEMVHDAWIGNYYLLASGKMATDSWIGGYYVDDSGAWIPNATR